MNPLDELERLHREATPGPFVGTPGLQILNMDGHIIAPSVYAGVADDKPYVLADLVRCHVNARILATSRNIVPQVIALAKSVQTEIAVWADDEWCEACNLPHEQGHQPGCALGNTIAALDALLQAIESEVSR